MSPSRRGLLRGGAGLLGAGLLGPTSVLGLPAMAAAGSKRLVVVLASGGWDVTFALDPKLGVPGVEGPEVDEDPDDPEDRESVYTFGEIPVVVNERKRPAVGRFFAAHGQRAVVVNGVHMASVSHEAALVRLLTGTGDLRAPDFLAVAGSEAGELPLGYVDLSGQAFFGPYTTRSGRMGQGGQLRFLVDPSARLRAPAHEPWTYPTWGPDDADRAALDAFVTGRADQLAARRPAAAEVMDQLRESRYVAHRLRQEMGPAIGELSVGESATLISDGLAAVELLEAGVCRAVLLDSRAHWDTHNDNDQQHVSHQSLFLGLRLLVDGLIARGMLADTLVVVLSEMTRTPLRNRHFGKDHWPTTSAIVVGGGVSGGRVLGGTDDRLEALPVDLDTGAVDPAGEVLRYDHLVSGLLEAVDVDPREHLLRGGALRGLLG